MSESEYSFFSRKGDRKLSPFLAQRLYYEKLANSLDQDRDHALHSFIENPQGDIEVIKKVQKGVEITQKISKAEVGIEATAELLDQRLGMQKQLAKAGWYHWSAPFRWCVEAVVASCLVLVLTFIVPWDVVWQKFNDSSSSVLLSKVSRGFGLELAPVERDKQLQEEEADPLNKNAENAEALSDRGIDNESGEAGEKLDRSLANESIPEDIQGPTSSAYYQGVVYRAFLQTSTLDEVTTRLKQHLTRLGAKKASNVELGWKRPGGSYFHFTIPESQYSEALNGISEIGKVSIREDAHEQVMPEGFRRVILWVEEVEAEQE